MSGLDEVARADRKFFLLEEGELIKTKLFLDVPDFNREELIEYIETNYKWSRYIWNIEYEITSTAVYGGTDVYYPVVEIVVPRWTWMKEKYREVYGRQGHNRYMGFVKILLEYEAIKRRERRNG